MYIHLKKISKERFKECGWDYIGLNFYDGMVFVKMINGIKVGIQLYDDDSPYTNELNYMCFENKLPIPDDLVAIANEVKRLEEN